LAFLTQNKAKWCKILIITLVFEKKAKLSKIAENCDHSIDPGVTRLGEFSQIGRWFSLAKFFLITEAVQKFWLLFPTVKVMRKF
jgi:tetrahydromethanopterin S-methyltransferase subunit B